MVGVSVSGASGRDCCLSMVLASAVPGPDRRDGIRSSDSRGAYLAWPRSDSGSRERCGLLTIQTTVTPLFDVRHRRVGPGVCQVMSVGSRDAESVCPLGHVIARRVQSVLLWRVVRLVLIQVALAA